MNEYDEVELTTDRSEWNLPAGTRGTVVDVVPGKDVVIVEFSVPHGENVVHLVPRTALRVTDQYVAPASSVAAHP